MSSLALRPLPAAFLMSFASSVLAARTVLLPPVTASVTVPADAGRVSLRAERCCQA